MQKESSSVIPGPEGCLQAAAMDESEQQHLDS
jgi:hypothetical protein